MKLDNVVVDQYLQEESQRLLSVIQQKTPIIFNNVEEHQFSKNEHNGKYYEIAYTQNSTGDDLVTIKFQQDDMYIAVVSTLSEGEILSYLKW